MKRVFLAGTAFMLILTVGCGAGGETLDGLSEKPPEHLESYKDQPVQEDLETLPEIQESSKAPEPEAPPLPAPTYRTLPDIWVQAVPAYLFSYYPDGTTDLRLLQGKEEGYQNISDYGIELYDLRSNLLLYTAPNEEQMNAQAFKLFDMDAGTAVWIDREEVLAPFCQVRFLSNNKICIARGGEYLILYEADGEPSQTQLPFDRGTTLREIESLDGFLSSHFYFQFVYERYPATVEYNPNRQEYVMVYHRTPFDGMDFDAEIEPDLEPEEGVSSRIGIAIYSESGELKRQFDLDLEFQHRWSGSNLNTWLHFPADQPDCVCLVSNGAAYIINLETNDYTPIDGYEYGDAYGMTFSPAGRFPFYPLQPSCPLYVEYSESGTHVYALDTEEEIVLLEGGYLLEGYIAQEDGACHLIFSLDSSLMTPKGHPYQEAVNHEAE